MAFHLGRDREAQILLEKCAVQMQMLAVCETDLVEIASMGYTIAEARLGLRAAQGDRKLAVEQIMKRREEKQDMRKKEEEERERGKLRDKLGRFFLQCITENFKPGRLDFFYDLDVLMEVGSILATTRPSWAWAIPRFIPFC